MITFFSEYNKLMKANNKQITTPPDFLILRKLDKSREKNQINQMQHKKQIKRT